MRDTNKNHIQTVMFSLDLLDCFTIKHPSWGVRQLARKVGKHPSVVQRSLATLEYCGYLYKSSSSREYSLGLKCIELGSIANHNLNFSQITQSLLQQVVDKTGESAFFYRLNPILETATCLGVQENTSPIHFTASVGQQVALHQAPYGKIILAFQSAEYVEKYCVRHQLKGDDISELNRLKKSGFVYSREKIVAGTQGLSVPVKDLNNRVAGSLCIAASVDGSQEQDLIKQLPVLKKVASQLKPMLI